MSGRTCGRQPQLARRPAPPQRRPVTPPLSQRGPRREPRMRRRDKWSSESRPAPRRAAIRSQLAVDHHPVVVPRTRGTSVAGRALRTPAEAVGRPDAAHRLGLLVDATGFFAVALVLAGCAARARRRRRPLGRRPAGTGSCRLAARAGYADLAAGEEALDHWARVVRLLEQEQVAAVDDVQASAGDQTGEIRAFLGRASGSRAPPSTRVGAVSVLSHRRLDQPVMADSCWK